MADPKPKTVKELKAELEAAGAAYRDACDACDKAYGAAYRDACDACYAACEAYKAASAAYLKALKSQENSDD